jgi:hypothetical protein
MHAPFGAVLCGVGKNPVLSGNSIERESAGGMTLSVANSKSSGYSRIRRRSKPPSNHRRLACSIRRRNARPSQIWDQSRIIANDSRDTGVSLSRDTCGRDFRPIVRVRDVQRRQRVRRFGQELEVVLASWFVS